MNANSRPELCLLRPTWAEIEPAAFTRNLRAVGSRLPRGSRVIAVLKANAYGHGAAALSHHCTPDDVAMIAVAILEEAVELRRGGVKLPILLLGPLTAAQVPEAIAYDLKMGLPGPEALESVCAAARERDVHVHIKLDTGTGRMGSTEAELPRVIELIRSAPQLHVDGIYTHFATADDPGSRFMEQQSAHFDRMLARLRAAGITAPVHHRSNSSAVMRGFVKPGDYVRVGLALYGGEPLVDDTCPLEPVMRWRTEIMRLKDLPAGHPVGYGRTFQAARPSRIATLPVGYADGYNRLLSNCGEVLVRGRRAPVVGRVSMDLVTIDVTDIDGVAVGDEVVLLGDSITAEEIAAKIGTISYEVFCNVSARVPRVYRAANDVTGDAFVS